MKAYKVFNHDWTCQGFKYEFGKWYSCDEDKLKMCEYGFHSCDRLEDCFRYYACVPWNRIAVVEIDGKVIKKFDKNCSSKIKLIEEVPFHKIHEHLEDYV